MSRCEDWPCCGHESGCCPDFDDSGNQLNMVCTCGAKLPVDARYSICEGCMESERDYDDDPAWDEDYDDEPDNLDGDWDSGMASAGWGTDEDYGDYGSSEDW